MIGKVSHIDLISKMSNNGKVYNSAYIHFEYWYDSIATNNLKSKLQEGKETKLVYDDPWHWIVLENKSRKYISGERKQRINLNLDKEELEKGEIKEKEVIQQLPKQKEVVEYGQEYQEMYIKSLENEVAIQQRRIKRLEETIFKLTMINTFPENSEIFKFNQEVTSNPSPSPISPKKVSFQIKVTEEDKKNRIEATSDLCGNN